MDLYLSVRLWQVVAPSAAPVYPAEGEGSAPQAPAERNSKPLCWISARPPDYSPWCAYHLSSRGTCAHPEHAPEQRTYLNTGPGERTETCWAETDLAFEKCFEKMNHLCVDGGRSHDFNIEHPSVVIHPLHARKRNLDKHQSIKVSLNKSSSNFEGRTVHSGYIVHFMLAPCFNIWTTDRTFSHFFSKFFNSNIFLDALLLS